MREFRNPTLFSLQFTTARNDAIDFSDGGLNSLLDDTASCGGLAALLFGTS
jgi:hypothetical protein